MASNERSILVSFIIVVAVILCCHADTAPIGTSTHRAKSIFKEAATQYANEVDKVVEKHPGLALLRFLEETDRCLIRMWRMTPLDSDLAQHHTLPYPLKGAPKCIMPAWKRFMKVVADAKSGPPQWKSWEEIANRYYD